MRSRMHPSFLGSPLGTKIGESKEWPHTHPSWRVREEVHSRKDFYRLVSSPEGSLRRAGNELIPVPPSRPKAIGLAVGEILHSYLVFSLFESGHSFFQLGSVKAIVLDDFLTINQRRAPSSEAISNTYSPIWSLEHSGENHAVFLFSLGDARSMKPLGKVPSATVQARRTWATFPIGPRRRRYLRFLIRFPGLRWVPPSGEDQLSVGFDFRLSHGASVGPLSEGRSSGFGFLLRGLPPNHIACVATGWPSLRQGVTVRL